MPLTFIAQGPMLIPSGGVTFDPAFKGTDVTLSNGNLTMTSPLGTTQSAMSTRSVSGGKRYFEVFMNNASSGVVTGLGWAIGSYNASLILGDTATADSLNNRSQGVLRFNNNTLNFGGSWTTGSIGMMAMDFPNALVYTGKDGVWDGSMDPVAGTGGVTVPSMPSGPYFAAALCHDGAIQTGHFSAATSIYLPSGWLTWSD